MNFPNVHFYKIKFLIVPHLFSAKVFSTMDDMHLKIIDNILSICERGRSTIPSQPDKRYGIGRQDTGFNFANFALTCT